MKDRTKIQLLIEEGSVKKCCEKRLPPTQYTGEGIEETFTLTDYGESRYGTLKNAMRCITTNSPSITDKY